MSRAEERERALAAHEAGQVALLEARLLEAERRAAAIGEVDLARAEAEADATRLREQVAELERVNAELRATVEHLQEVMAGLKSSVSWRLTRPLRALKRS